MLAMRVAAAALLLAACSGDASDPGPPEEPPPDSIMVVRFRDFQIVSGDRQTAQVVLPAAGAVALLLDTLPPNLLPEPLRARILYDTTYQVVPAGAQFSLSSSVAVEYVTTNPKCGRPWVSSVQPDTAGYVENFWEKGTLANEICTMEVRVLENSTPRVDTVFTATFLPGPPTVGYVEQDTTILRTHPGVRQLVRSDTMNIRPWMFGARDALGNWILPAQIDTLEVKVLLAEDFLDEGRWALLEPIQNWKVYVGPQPRKIALWLQVGPIWRYTFYVERVQ